MFVEVMGSVGGGMEKSGKRDGKVCWGVGGGEGRCGEVCWGVRGDGERGVRGGECR